jgi:hypothetical protein
MGIGKGRLDRWRFLFFSDQAARRSPLEPGEVLLPFRVVRRKLRHARHDLMALAGRILRECPFLAPLGNCGKLSRGLLTSRAAIGLVRVGLRETGCYAARFSPI